MDAHGKKEEPAKMERYMQLWIIVAHSVDSKSDLQNTNLEFLMIAAFGNPVVPTQIRQNCMQYCGRVWIIIIYNFKHVTYNKWLLMLVRHVLS